MHSKAIPALLYTLQNNTIFIALNNLPGLMYQISSQGKIFTTAIFSVMLLKRRLTKGQWGCLVTLALGVVAVQYRVDADAKRTTLSELLAPASTTTYSPVALLNEAAGDTRGDDGQNLFYGMVAVLIGVTCSGAAGTYFEFVLKGIGCGNLFFCLFVFLFSFFFISFFNTFN